MGKSLFHIIFFIFFFCVTTVHSFSQQVHGSISLRCENITLSSLIDSIRLKSGLKISYDVNSIPVDSVLSVNISGKDPEEILRMILKSPDIEILGHGNQLVIRKKKTGGPRFVVLKGEVLDYDYKPLSLVNIGFKNRPLGTVTNNAGEFELKVPVSYSGDTLLFSCLGYKVERIPVRSAGTDLQVLLAETSISLPEVIIKYRNVNEIIEQFLKHRKNNYPEKSILVTAFFREIIKQNKKFVNVSEAVLQILKYPYDQPFKLELVKFIKGRKYRDVEKMKDINFRLEGGPFYFSRIDIARYMDFFPQEGEEQLYRYKFEGLDYEYEKMVYVVSFEPYDDNGELLYKGILRFETDSYALVSAEFELTKNTLRESRKYLIRKESPQIKARPYYARYYINYRPYKDIWVLNKVKGELKVRINDKRTKKKSVFTAVTEMLMSDFKDASGTRFKPSETFKPNYILTDKIKEYDPEFWKNYNVIKPDEDIENVFKNNGTTQKGER